MLLLEPMLLLIWFIIIFGVSRFFVYWMLLCGLAKK